MPFTRLRVRFPDYLRNLYVPFSSVYFPFVARQYALVGKQRASESLNAAIRFVAFATLFGAAVAVLFGREILQTVFTDKYSGSAPVFVVLMFNLSIALISNVMGNTLVAAGDTQKPPIINAFNAGASWLGSFLLIPVFGLIGACVANTIGTTVALPLNRYFLRRSVKLMDRPYLKPLALFCAWSLLVIVIRPNSPLIRVGFLVGYLLGCVLWSIVTKEDITLLVAASGIGSWPQVRRLGLWLSRL